MDFDLESKKSWRNKQKDMVITDRFFGLTWMAAGVILLGIIILVSSCQGAHAYTNDEIADAIYWAEGGVKANKPFGILSVKCEGYHDCRRICKNTIQNNRRRYQEYGFRNHSHFLEFLAHRYSPVGAKNDRLGLNKNWLRNVQWFLNHPRKINVS